MTERYDLIADLRCDGWKWTEIGREVRCSRATVYRALKRAGLITSAPPAARADRDQRIVQLRLRGWTWQGIADELGVSTAIVGAALKRARLVRQYAGTPC